MDNSENANPSAGALLTAATTTTRRSRSESVHRPRGNCAVCRRDIALRIDGNTIAHYPPAGAWPCLGEGRPPKERAS